jgi:PleD family two-component response regulator
MERCACDASQPEAIDHGPTLDISIERASRRVLLADDDRVQCLILKRVLNEWGYSVDVYHDGTSAWSASQADDAPYIFVLDWMMPGLDGDELCRRVRSARKSSPTYILMLTGRGSKEDILAGLQAGADDYLQKPADRDELRARIRNGERIIELQLSLAKRIQELEGALEKVKQLQGLLPICAYCKKVRRDNNYWQQVEAYLSMYVDVRFSHGICPDCYESIVEPQLRELESNDPEVT